MNPRSSSPPRAASLYTGLVPANENPKKLPVKKAKPAVSSVAAGEPWKAFQVRHRSKEVKRDAILKTAAHLFLEHGYQKTSMSLLSARLKITKPSLYYYFQNKEEILVECYRVGIAEIDGCLQRSNLEAGTGLAKLRLYVHAYAITVLTDDFGRCVAMIDDSELSKETRRGVRNLKRRIDISIRELVEAGIKDKSIAPCNPKLVSFAIAGAINWAGTWYKPTGELSPDEIAQAFTQILTGRLDRQTEFKAN
jgi:AcrR family transcriptional regulator